MSKTSLRKSRRRVNTLIYIILIIISILWLFPFFYLIVQSFRLEPGATTNYFWPKKIGFDNYIFIFTSKSPFNFSKWYLNTLIISIITCVLQTIIVLMVSYAFSRLRFKFRKVYMKLILILGMFPGFLSMIAIYNVLKLMGLTQSLYSIIIIYCGSAAMQYYISKGFFDTIPYSLDEAAKIDGASKHQIFIKIILPLAKPIIVYTMLMAFIAPWGEYMLVSYLAGTDPEKFNVAVGLKQWLSDKNIYEYFTKFCAGAVVISIPVTILFFLLQRYYVEGVTGGSVKG